MATAPTHRIAYSVSEVSQLTGIGKTKLYQLIADGQLGSRKIGRRVFYSIDGPYVVEKVKLILDALEPMAELCVPFKDLEDGAAA